MKMFLFFTLIYSSFSSICQEVISLDVKDCDSSTNNRYLADRIIAMKTNGDTVMLDVGLTKNCSFIPKVTLNLVNDTLYMHVENSSRLHAACSCYKEIKIIATGIPDTNINVVHCFSQTRLRQNGDFVDEPDTVILSKGKNIFIFPELAEIMNPKEDNALNQEGAKIGLWRAYDSVSQNIRLASYYKNRGHGKSEIVWQAYFDTNGDLITICGKQGLGGSSDLEECINSDEYRELFNIERKTE